MVKSYHVKDYIKSGIIDNINNCEDVIEAVIEDTSSTQIEVEFTDHSCNGDKSKFRIVIELVE